jgi:NO-binding membrane sensor protein with MHYT domain
MGAYLNSIAKALTGFVGAAYVVYQTSTLASSAGGSAVTKDEWVAIIVGGVLAGFAVWAIPNGPESVK